jgi:hypothetical protein
LVPVARPSWKLLALLVVCPTIAGCPRTWYLTIPDVEDPAHPVLCASLRPNCRGDGVTLPDLMVAKFDAAELAGPTRMPKEAWIIASTANSALREFSYGQTPAGWREVQPPPPLSVGAWYTVGDFFFRVTSEEEGYAGDVCHAADFLERVNSSQAPGCRAADR